MKKSVKSQKVIAMSWLLALLTFLGAGCADLPNSLPGGFNYADTSDETIVGNDKEEVTGSEEQELPQDHRSYDKAEVTDTGLYDDPLLYEEYDSSAVLVMYLTVSTGNEADSSNHTWKEVNTYSAYDYEAMGVDRYKVDGILQIDETGDGLTEDSFGYGESVPNVSVQVRGQSSSGSIEKNYKIRIKDGKGEFREQRTLNLNKHYGDPFRLINRLCYSLAEPIPVVIAGRTQFVHLYVKDLTDGANEGISPSQWPPKSADESGYVDYGLYTMVEQVNRTYLKNHGFDENGQLYKVTFFEWNKYDAVMLPRDDPEFSLSDFEKYIEIKGNEDTSKLTNVVEKINNYSIPIEEIIDEHFDEDNLFYWMAFNILNGNNDVGPRNLFLYSPLNSERFYFMCWDMDASFKYQWNKSRGRQYGESWEQGMTKYLGLILIQRVMKEPQYRQKLTDAVEDLYSNYVSPDIVGEKAGEFSEITRSYLFHNGADSSGSVIEEKQFDQMIAGFPDEVEHQYQAFQESMKKPWPFFVGVPSVQEDNKDKLTLSWGVSYDYGGEEVTYSYLLATDPYFKHVIDSAEGIRIPVATTDILPPGTYYLRVVATNRSGYSMDCFDYANEKNAGKIYGCYVFVVNEDGTMVPYVSEE